jgi:hypothetical protein
MLSEEILVLEMDGARFVSSHSKVKTQLYHVEEQQLENCSNEQSTICQTIEILSINAIRGLAGCRTSMLGHEQHVKTQQKPLEMTLHYCSSFCPSCSLVPTV